MYICLLLFAGSFGLQAMQEVKREKHIVVAHGGHPWLGVSIQDVTDELLSAENLSVREGAYVTEVIKESPADSAGLRGGDVIIEFNNRKIYDADGLLTAVRKAKSGEPVKLIADRKGRKIDMQVTLRERSRRTAMSIPRPPTPPKPMAWSSRSGRIGLKLINLNPQLGEYFQVPEGKGVLIEEVVEESPAQRAGFKAGDVILSVDTTEIASVRELRRALSGYDSGDRANVVVMRNRSRTSLTLEFEEKPYSYDGWRHGTEDFDGDVFIFTPEDRERLRGELKNLRPHLDELRIELDGLREHFKDFKIEFPDNFLQEFRFEAPDDMLKDIRIHREVIRI